MRKVRFYYKGNTIYGQVNEFVDFPDETRDEEIQSSFEDWLWETSGANWVEVGDE